MATRELSDGYRLNDDPQAVDLDALWTFLSTEAYWGRWRTREVVERQVRGAWRVGVLRHDNRQVGFARAVSDGEALAYLADVYVESAHRGRGLGAALVRFVVDEGAGAGFRWLLHTRDAHGLYARFGFAPPSVRLLERPGSVEHAPGPAPAARPRDDRDGPPVEVRSAGPADRGEVTEIYNHYVTHSAATFDTAPFTVEQRSGWFAQYADSGRHRLFVAKLDGRVVGYASSSPLRPKPAYATSVETSVYVHHDAVGRGIGRRLYRVLFDALAGTGVHRAYAGIALPNDASVALHRSFGFHDVGVEREVGHKFGRYWDVLRLERPI